MSRITAWIFLIFLCSYLPMTTPASAQSVAPAIDLECEAINPSGNLELHVSLNESATDYATCTASNPNIYEEKIVIYTQNEAGLAVAHPEEIIVAGLSDAEFQVTIRADSGTPAMTSQLRVVAYVVEVAGVDLNGINTGSQDDEDSVIVQIMQYYDVKVEPVPSILIDVSDASDKYEYQSFPFVEIYNVGNGWDKFVFDFDDLYQSDMISFYYCCSTMNYLSQPIEELVENRYSVSIRLLAEIDQSYIPDWPINSEGMHEISFTSTFTATSVYSCEYEDECKSDSVQQTITFVHEATEVTMLTSSESGNQLLIYGVGSGGLLLLLIFLLAVKNRR